MAERKVSQVFQRQEFAKPLIPLIKLLARHWDRENKRKRCCLLWSSKQRLFNLSKSRATRNERAHHYYFGNLWKQGYFHLRWFCISRYMDISLGLHILSGMCLAYYQEIQRTKDTVSFFSFWITSMIILFSKRKIVRH